MKNKLVDLNNHLFAQMERLSDEKLKGEKLTEELNRARAITGVGNAIISNGKLALEVQEKLGGVKNLPDMLTHGEQGR